MLGKLQGQLLVVTIHKLLPVWDPKEIPLKLHHTILNYRLINWYDLTYPLLFSYIQNWPRFSTNIPRHQNKGIFPKPPMKFGTNNWVESVWLHYSWFMISCLAYLHWFTPIEDISWFLVFLANVSIISLVQVGQRKLNQTKKLAFGRCSLYSSKEAQFFEDDFVGK